MSEHNLHLKLSTWETLKKGNGFAEEKISKLPAIIPSSTCGKVATLQSTATFRVQTTGSEIGDGQKDGS